MSWWVPFPLDFLSDPRVQVLPLSAQGVLTRLVLQARGGDVLPYVNHHDALGTVAVIALREGAPADARASVGDEVDRLRDAGLLTWDDAARTLSLHLSAAAPPRPRGASPVVRTKPSDHAERATSRADRHYFARRQRQWRDVPADVTWEAWLASPEGVAWTEGRPTAPRSATPATGATPATPRLQRPPATPPCNAPATPPPPHTPSPRKEREKETETPNLQRPATPPATQGVAGALQPLQPLQALRLSTVESLGVRADEVVAVLRQRAARQLFLSEDSRTLGALQTVATDLSAVGRWALADYETLADWIAAGGLGWWTSRKPDLAYLLRPGVLAKHLEEAREWDEAGRRPIVHRARPEAPRPTTARRAPPARVSRADEFNDDGEDPLLALARAP